MRFMLENTVADVTGYTDVKNECSAGHDVYVAISPDAVSHEMQVPPRYFFTEESAKKIRAFGMTPFSSAFGMTPLKEVE